MLEFQLANFFKIIFFGIRLIKNVILLVAQVHAPETILAAFAVVTEIAVGAVQAVAAKIAVITFLDVDSFITQLGFFGERAVNAIAA